ncbi:hypothetical protein B0H16DRAFT_1635314 [Mycena metata]|uniref:Uncharacterized protein n=1 Tax=Mycena metata TaxID=1033252 RepID=A0AAD7M9H9_9AGAR|nr:hypothetical protein B0H16DRAFT_1635314 [Mycena metata]
MTGDLDDEGTLFSLSNTNITTDEFVGYIHSKGHIHPTLGSPFGTGLTNHFTPQFKRLAAFQGDYVFNGTRRFFLQHTSKTQNTWSWLGKRGKSTPVLGASDGNEVDIWFPSANSTDFAGVDALINFINTLDPNHSGTKANASQTVFWPKWNTSTSDGSPSHLTFSDPDVVNVTSENFRVDVMQFLLGLLLKEASG